jgi:hypothetical protein
MLHRGKTQSKVGVAPGATASSPAPRAGGKALAPRGFLGFNLNKTG